MIPIRILSKSVRNQVKLPFQWLSITVRLSSSSSDSSSDSDSDNEKNKRKKTDVKDDIKNKPKDALSSLIENMLQKKPTSKEATSFLPPKRRELRPRDAKGQPFEKQLTRAARDVAETIKGDKDKVTSELISKLLGMKEKTKAAKPVHINNVISDMLAKRKWTSQTRKSNDLSVIKQLKRDSESQNVSAEERQRFSNRMTAQLMTGPLFGTVSEPASNLPELKTWKKLEERELAILVTHPPNNVFEELIQWTNEGKLWKFPIDNEQGMEEERKVHFSEHIFMERHLKGWCPTKGPVRHFMELVCNGLSKNPFMTVEEKVDHIMWYKQYFEEKEQVLQELGAIPGPLSENAKKVET